MKKLKINDFNEAQPPPSTLIPWPSQFALQKIYIFKYMYIDLWYFLLEGCENAPKSIRTQANDAFGITIADDILTLHPVASIKASHNAHLDHELSFGELLQEKNDSLHHIKKAKWPAKNIDTLAKVFWNLKNHPHWCIINREQALLHYAWAIC